MEPDGTDQDDLFDDAWQAPTRTSRLTVVLVVALLVVAGFAGGVLVQKHHDVALAAAAAGTGTRRAGGAGQGGRGQGSSAATAAAGPDAALPVVTGTVRTVDADTLEVTDPTGAVVRVHVPAIATVTTPGLGGPAMGSPVSVAGTKEVDGSVDATSVTVRRPGT